ncbi:hypothetical protein ACTXT7_002856 [Hymenolepis weldensis]
MSHPTGTCSQIMESNNNIVSQPITNATILTFNENSMLSCATEESSIDKMIIDLLKNGRDSRSIIEPKSSIISQFSLPSSSNSQGISNDPSVTTSVITPQVVTKREEPSNDKQQQVEDKDEDEEEESKLTIEESFQLPDKISPEG